MIKKIMICFCLFTCLLSGCSSEDTLLTKLEKQLGREAVTNEEESKLLTHTFSNSNDEGIQITSVSINTQLIQKDDLEYLKISYMKSRKLFNGVYSNISMNVVFSKSKISTEYIYDAGTTSGAFMRRHEEYEGEIKTKNDKTTFTNNDGVKQTIYMLNEYLPILEDDLDIKLKDYGFIVDIDDAYKQVKDEVGAAEKEEQRRKEEAQEAYEQEKLEQEKELQEKLDAQNAAAQEAQEERERNNAIRQEQAQIEKDLQEQEKQESRRQDYQSALTVLNYIENNLNSENLYTQAYDKYQSIQWISDEGYSMKNSLSSILMNVQSLNSSNGQNQEFYKNQIKESINAFKSDFAI